MPRVRDEASYEEMQASIKNIARQQMAQMGTASISLRGIARELDITAPALYRYYPRVDDLITALIIENFNALADALEAAAAKVADRPTSEQLFEVLLAYRRWALDHPTDFELIYGNPIPDYHAPGELTVPAVVRTFVPIVRLIEQARQQGILIPQPPYDQIPPSVQAHAQTLIERESYPIQVISYHLAMIGWAYIHGTIMLELFSHIGPSVGDVEAFYRNGLRALMISFGMKI